MKGILALEDGRTFTGVSFGAEGKSQGEIVFNTSMTGYQEILTDPSYHGQIVTMTYPLIGNYGTNDGDMESCKPRARGFVVRENCAYPSNWRNEKPLDTYLKDNGIVALSEIDTRAVTRHIRTAGAMRAVIAARDYSPEELVEEAKKSPSLVGRDLVSEVTCKEAYEWTEPCAWRAPDPDGRRYKVVAMDFGIKYNISRYLVSFGCDVTVVPATTSAEEVLAMNPDGIFLSNGPGDPAGVPHVVENIRKLLGKKPIFGICLGHQLLGLALGGSTYKLKFGHRGANQPVMDMATRRVHITTQNHGFCVEHESLSALDVEVTHMNLNDDTVEGLYQKDMKFFCVQFHPEAAAGPHDAEYLFGRFIDLMAENS